MAAFMLGRIDDYFVIREAEYHARVERGDLLGAARAAVWIGTQRMVSGEMGPGSGWLARAARHVEEDGSDCVERAYVLLPDMLAAEASGDVDQATAVATEAVATARRFGDQDLTALALHELGRFLVSSGHVVRGMALLDEAMVSVNLGKSSPMVTGIVYCGVISGCWSVYDLRRAQEWTSSMTAWCDAQPELAAFNGECAVRRAELKQLHGAWSEALDELADVGDSEADAWVAGTAAYVRGNLDRLQGRFDAADEAFRLAARLGVEPQPGLALLRLGEGSPQAAAAMVRRALSDLQDAGARVELLFAATEILMSVGEADEANACVAELGQLAGVHASPITQSLADHARAGIDVQRGRPEAALEPLRKALRHWLQLKAPYQEARARLLLATCCSELGDHESADRELETARGTFKRLGAVPDLARVDAMRGTNGDDLLTARELEVLQLLATGTTNKAIAAALVLSERTVDRHVSNIYTKLGVSNRVAATAYAFERQLI